jgi:hypothetical protein
MARDHRLDMVDYLRYWAAHERTFLPDEQTIEELDVIAKFLMNPQMRAHHDVFACHRDKALFFAITKACIAELDKQNEKIGQDLKPFHLLWDRGERDEARDYLRTKVSSSETEFERIILSSFLENMTGI